MRDKRYDDIPFDATDSEYELMVSAINTELDHGSFTIADAAVHSFAVWCPRGWAFDWDGDVRFTKSLENAALFDLRHADYVASRLGGCVYDTETDHLLTMEERRS